MYSGQEIVSQEECKIILAEFYEGVDCYNETTKAIKFTLLDWATATYDAGTKTLETINFSCRPIIMDTDLRVTFEATLPEGTTGLEVVMHTGTYEKLRIMPLIYLPTCSTYVWDDLYNDDPDNYGDWAYVDTFCNDGANTEVVVFGEVDSVTSTSITIVGYQDDLATNSNPLVLEFLDASDQVKTISPTFLEEARDVTTWEYNSETQLVEEVVTTKTAVIITVLAATSIRFSGLYSYTAKLYDCSTLSYVGDVISSCNLTLPDYETQITSLTDTFTEVDGWYVSADTEFRLLPETIFKRLEGTVYYFEGANQIEYRKPVQGIYDLTRCSYDPETFGYFVQFPMFYYEDGVWRLDIYLYGNFSISGHEITDLTTGDVYAYYTFGGVPLTLNTIVVDGILSTIINTGCSVSYTVNGGAAIEIISFGAPISDDYRKVWDPAKCKFIVTCDSVGLLPCPCIICTPEVGDESVHLYTNPVEGACTTEGSLPENETLSGCAAGYFHGLGSFPDIPVVLPPAVPVATSSSSDYVFVIGLDMYIALPTLVGFTYFTWVGNLASGVELAVIEDGASDSSQTVRVLPFIYLSVFKIPFKYITETGIDTRLWHDTTIWSDDYIRIMCYPSDTIGILPCYGWEASGCEPNWPPVSMCDDPDYGKTDAELRMKGIYPGPGLFDIQIELGEMQGRLPTEWNSGYDWSWCCGWVTCEINRPTKGTDIIVGIDNIADLDLITCENDLKLKYKYTNIRLGYVIPPVASYGAFQTLYDEYVETVSLFVSDDAEAYAYYTELYAQELLDFGDEDVLPPGYDENAP